MFFTTISHAIAPNISNFHGISRMIQIIGFAISHNRRINFGHLIMEEIIKNQQSARLHYSLYPRFLQIVLEHRMTQTQLSTYQRSRMIDPPVLSLRPAMVLLNNDHYPNVIIPARITDPIHEFFNACDQVVQDLQVEEGEEEEDEQDDQDIDSSNVESESLDHDQPEPSGVQKSTKDEILPEVEVAEEVYNPGYPAQNADKGNLPNFDLGDLFGNKYLSFLDLHEPHQKTHTEPSVAIGSDKESENPPVLTTAVEQQILPQSLLLHYPLKRKLLYVSERANLKRSPKREWSNVFVLENAALPESKRQKLIHEATANLNPIYSKEPNTSSPINISEDELTATKRGDTDSKLPTTTLSNVSTSPEVLTLDPIRDIPHFDLSGEIR